MADRSYPPSRSYHDRSYDVKGRYQNFYGGLEVFPELVSTGGGGVPRAGDAPRTIIWRILIWYLLNPFGHSSAVQLRVGARYA